MEHFEILKQVRSFISVITVTVSRDDAAMGDVNYNITALRFVGRHFTQRLTAPKLSLNRSRVRERSRMYTPPLTLRHATHSRHIQVA